MKLLLPFPLRNLYVINIYVNNYYCVWEGEGEGEGEREEGEGRKRENRKEPELILYHGSLRKWQRERATIPLLLLVCPEDLLTSSTDCVKQNEVFPAKVSTVEVNIDSAEI